MADCQQNLTDKASVLAQVMATLLTTGNQGTNEDRLVWSCVVGAQIVELAEKMHPIGNTDA